MEEAISELLKSGILGAVAVLAGYAFWRERNRNSEIQDLRVSDSKSFYKEYISLVDRVTKVMNDLTNVIERGDRK